MALIKEVEYKGLTCNYHKIVRIDVEFYGHTPNSNTYTKMDVEVALFQNVTQRDDSVDRALRIKQYHFLQSGPNPPVSEKIEKVYKALKLLPEFADAVDA